MQGGLRDGEASYSRVLGTLLVHALACLPPQEFRQVERRAREMGPGVIACTYSSSNLHVLTLHSEISTRCCHTDGPAPSCQLACLPVTVKVVQVVPTIYFTILKGLRWGNTWPYCSPSISQRPSLVNQAPILTTCTGLLSLGDTTMAVTVGHPESE